MFLSSTSILGVSRFRWSKTQQENTRFLYKVLGHLGVSNGKFQIHGQLERILIFNTANRRNSFWTKREFGPLVILFNSL